MSSDGKLIPLNITPGIYKDVTEYAAEGHWIDSNNIRFRDGHAEKIGGWVHEQTYQVSNTSITNFTGVARDIETWVDLSAVPYLAVGTHKKLELLKAGLIYDITPIVTVVTVANRINTSTGSNLVIVSVTAHNANTDDYVVITSLQTTVGVNEYLDGQYVITTVPNADSFGISVLNAATSTSTAAGGNVTVTFLLPTGLQSNGAAFGWGAGTWSRGGWGSAASSGVATELAQWSLDVWGQDLLACRKGGYLYRWSASAGPTTRAALVTAAPTINNLIMVHNASKHVMSFGCTDLTGVFDPLLVRWSDQDNINDWTPTVSNAAGEFPLEGGNQIMAVQQTRRETLILTDDVVHVMHFTGDQDTFAFEQIGEGSGALSQHCIVDANGTPYWIGKGAFYKYEGAIKALDTTIDKYLFRSDSANSINLEQNEKIFAGLNSMFNEIIWLYPSRDSEEIDSYVIHNYVDDNWTVGTIDRTVWEDVGVFHKPYAVNSSGTLYIHEEGYDNDGQPLPATLESAWFDIDDGNELLFMDRIIPDIRRLNGKNISLTIQVKKYPESSETVTKGPYTITDTTRKISLRARGRQAKVLLEQNVTDGSFELGKMRVDVLPDGKR